MYTCVKAGTWVSQSHELPERSRIPEIRRQHCLFGLSFWYQPYAAWALPSKGWVYNDWHLVSAGPWGFPSVSAVKNPPAMQEMQEMWVRSLDWEDPLEESMATPSSILAWRVHGVLVGFWWAWWATVHGVTNSQTQLKQLTTHAHFFFLDVN